MRGDHVTQSPRLIAGGDAGDSARDGAAPASAPGPATKIPVWDIAVRVFHWLLVISVLSSWLTGGTGSRLHELSGSAVAALVIFRVVWGFAGTPRARFGDFVRSPSNLLSYLVDVARNRAGRHVGHNPAGAYMIVALLLCLTVITVTGFMQMTSQFFGIVWVETVHHYAANALLALVPVHVLGVVVSSWMHQENLVGAMITGDKSLEPAEIEAGPALPTPHEQVMMRLHANQGFSILLFLLAGALYIGWNSTSHRVATTVTEPTATAGTAIASQANQAVSLAIQESAAALARDKQDYVTGGPEDATQTWLISSGGRLYDNWYASLGKKGPSETHLSWPADNKNLSGDATWRCKNCHGWDYMGRDGQYRSGANATGIVGLQRMRGRDPNAIVAILGDARHGFNDDILPQHAKYRIAQFVSFGQHVATQYVLPNGKIRGNAAQGKPVFQSVCASCHGFDGRTRKLGGSGSPDYKGDPMFVGTKANAGPIEVLHKIRNGHPGAIMVSLRPFPIETAANLLAYVQTLPTK
jgi:cytochrome b